MQTMFLKIDDLLGIIVSAISYILGYGGILYGRST